MKKYYILYFLILILNYTQTLQAQLDMKALIPDAAATHKAVSDGNWFDTTTWDTGTIPGNGAIVIIPPDKKVIYSGASPAHIFAIRVDGEFTCSAQTSSESTQLTFDTFFATHNSHVRFLAENTGNNGLTVTIKAFDIEAFKADNLWNSTAKNHFSDGAPVTFKTRTGKGGDRYNSLEEALAGNFRIEESTGTSINDGPGVLGRYLWDPAQHSLGMITMGKLDILGAEKTNMLRLSADASAGQSQIILNEIPHGWSTGDELIITSGGNAGANRNGEDRSQILSINTSTINLEAPLSKNHEGNTAEDLHCYVGNLSRSIVFQSPQTDVVTQRGHVMAMHNDTHVTIKNTQFYRLGRTDKSKILDDFIWNNWIAPKVFKSKISPLGQEIAEMRPIPTNEMTNSRGRYSIHLHKLGASATAQMAQVTGNVVWNNPGWAITHHDSHANISNNVVYDVTGAGIVSETGSETGFWDNNLVVNIKKGHGSDPYESSLYHDDYLFDGQGLAMKGRAVLCRNNVIANANFGVGVINMNNSTTNLDRLDAKALATTRPGHEVDNFPLSVNGYSKEGDGVMPVEAALIMENTTIIDCYIGLRSIERDMGVNHESRSVFDGFKSWGCNIGVSINYQADYSFRDVYISGHRADRALGIDMWKHSHNQTFENIKMVDLQYGVRVSKAVLNTNQGPKTRNNGITPWLFVNLQTANVGDFYEILVDNPQVDPMFSYTEHADNSIHLSANDISPRPTTFTVVDSSLLQLDYAAMGADALKFKVDGIITDDFGSYNMGIQQALAQGDLRLDYPERIYQFASKERFEAYLSEHGVYKNKDKDDELYFIIPESLPNRRNFSYTTFPVRIAIKNAPSSGVFATATYEPPTALEPPLQLISRYATVSQSSIAQGLTYSDGYHDASPINPEAAKAVDGNNNGRINAQYYQRDLLPTGSFSQTQVEYQPYFDLDFGEEKEIEYIDIWNTVSLQGEDIETPAPEFQNFAVFISNTPFSATDFETSRAQAAYEFIHMGGSKRKFSVNNAGASGRYMRIQSSSTIATSLKFAEIEVIGKTKSTTLSVKSEEDQINSGVYPNPFDQRINIQLDKNYTKVHLEVFDSSGKSIYKTYHKELKQTSIPVNASTGVYFLRISNTEGLNVIKKLIKK